MVYPGATHTRFEHSLGVMHLAGEVFDVITNPQNVSEEIRDLFPDMLEHESRLYWRRVLRMAALTHDVGHLPFSHAAERELLPEGWDHEQLSRILIGSDEMGQIFHDVTPPLRPEDVARVALGVSGGEKASVWLDVLTEIITGDAFGVDRIDYLLRDSLHAGVAYGRFDHLRLLGTLRILPQSPTPSQSEELSLEPTIGVERGGLEAAESLAMARYLMFSQLYFHKTRRIYDIHLKDFLVDWLPGGKFSLSAEDHLGMTDHTVLSAMDEAVATEGSPGHDPARRIVRRDHFKVAYMIRPSDRAKRPDAFEAISQACKEQFGESIRTDEVSKDSPGIEFPVKTFSNEIASSLTLSTLLKSVPVAHSEAIYCSPPKLVEVKKWLEDNIETILQDNNAPEDV
jgi:uncharacterized protein